MLTFLSPAWLDALDHAARADAGLALATGDVGLVVEQVVTDVPDRDDVAYRVTFDHGQVSVVALTRPGEPAPHGELPVVRFSQDHRTATAIARGEESAQRAFMTGDLRVGGDLRALLDHQTALAALDDVFADVRARTDLGPALDVVDREA